MKKILITGASGFIGGFLVKEALNRGYETWAGVRSTSSRVNLQDERIRFIDLKYSDRESLTAQLADFVREHGPWDYVIHHAGPTKKLLSYQCPEYGQLDRGTCRIGLQA